MDINNKEILARNLAFYMDKNSIDRNKLCEDLNFKYSTVCEWLSAKKYPRMDKIEILANYFNINKSDLIEETPISKLTLKTSVGHILDNKDIRMIPVFESVSAGFGAYADEKIIEYIPLHIQNSYDADNMLAIKVIGNSMYPKIEDGDIIAVRKQSDFENGQIAVVLVDGDEGLVKKIYQEQNKITLVSCNPEYPDKVFIGEEIERLSVVGVVNMIIKRV